MCTPISFNSLSTIMVFIKAFLSIFIHGNFGNNTQTFQMYLFHLPYMEHVYLTNHTNF